MRAALLALAAATTPAAPGRAARGVAVLVGVGRAVLLVVRAGLGLGSSWSSSSECSSALSSVSVSPVLRRRRPPRRRRRRRVPSPPSSPSSDCASAASSAVRPRRSVLVGDLDRSSDRRCTACPRGRRLGSAGVWSPSRGSRHPALRRRGPRCRGRAGCGDGESSSAARLRSARHRWSPQPPALPRPGWSRRPARGPASARRPAPGTAPDSGRRAGDAYGGWSARRPVGSWPRCCRWRVLVPRWRRTGSSCSAAPLAGFGPRRRAGPALSAAQCLPGAASVSARRRSARVPLPGCPVWPEAVVSVERPRERVRREERDSVGAVAAARFPRRRPGRR